MTGCEGKLYFIRKQENFPDISVPSDMYFNDFRRRIQYMITLAENICYAAEKGKAKEEWNTHTLAQFRTFRKQMLDIADKVGGLEDNMVIECPNDEEVAKRDSETRRLIDSIFNRKGR